MIGGIIKFLVGLFVLATLAGCSITQSVEPIASTKMSEICIQENSAVMMKEFRPELQRQIESKGIHTRVYTGVKPDVCEFDLRYTANWQWDLAMYLSYVELRVYDSDRLAGVATYDARRGGGRMDKFGTTTAKLEPLINELFGSVAPARASADQAKGSTSPSTETMKNTDTASRLRELQGLYDEKLITEDEYSEMKRKILLNI